MLAQAGKIRPAAGQQLMHIRLMSDVKNQAVFFCIEYGFDGDAQLHNAQIAGQMAACPGNTGDQKFPDLCAKLAAFLIIQPQQIIVTVYFL